MQTIVVGVADVHLLHRQWLHHVWSTCGLVNETEHTFVDSTADDEFELRIQSEGHVIVVVVAKQLNDGRWHFRIARLGH